MKVSHKGRKFIQAMLGKRFVFVVTNVACIIVSVTRILIKARTVVIENLNYSIRAGEKIVVWQV
jgi:hypothetical protein